MLDVMELYVQWLVIESKLKILYKHANIHLKVTEVLGTAAEAAPTTERVTATAVRASDARCAVMGNRQGRLAATAVATTTRRTTTTARFIAVVVVARRTAAITAATTTIRNGRARAK